MLYYIWRVVYFAQDVLEWCTFPEMVSCVFVSFGVRSFYGFRAETAISADIRSGGVALEPVRPMSYQLARFAESLGSVVVEGELIGVSVPAVGAAILTGIDGSGIRVDRAAAGFPLLRHRLRRPAVSVREPYHGDRVLPADRHGVLIDAGLALPFFGEEPAA